MDHIASDARRRAPLTPAGEGALCLLDGRGLAIFLFRKGQTPFTASLFSRSELHYGLYVSISIPFFLVRIRGFGDVCAAVNALAQPGEARRSFATFQGDGEARLTLCGFPEPEIFGERRFVLRGDVLDELRQADASQSMAYEDAYACAAAATAVMARQGPGRMMGATVLYPDQPCE